MADPLSRPHPFFLPVGDRRLFLLWRRPSELRGSVILAPPFAEELNKSRRMFTLLADALAARGVGLLVPDLTGTGDSSGDFAEARWEAWIDDMAGAIRWLGGLEVPLLGAVGLRAGALLLGAVSKRLPVSIPRAVLWQPVLRGDNMLTRFLRLRVAAGAMSGGGGETTADLRRRLGEGESVEVAGYELHPHLVSALDAARLEPPGGEPSPPVWWFEVAADPARGPGPASRKVVEAWRERGVEVEAAAVAGEPFWTTQEIAEAPELVSRTAEVLCAGLEP